MGTSLAPGVHLAHKPVGMSSHALVESLRVGGGRLCHGGALDPFAEGLLLVLAGEGTKLFPYLHGVPKVYEAEVRWGTETDTGDPGGEVVATGDTSRLAADLLDAALERHRGWTEQVPPATSNKRVDGERAYVRAHRGEVVVLPPSRVFLSAARWTRHALPERSWLELTAAGGFYVRALVRDLGRETGASAYLHALCRRSIGPWSVPEPGVVRRVQGLGLLPWCPQRTVTTTERAGLRVGSELPTGLWAPAPWTVPDGYPEPPVRLVAEGRLLGLAEGSGEILRVTTCFGRGL